MQIHCGFDFDCSRISHVKYPKVHERNYRLARRLSRGADDNVTDFMYYARDATLPFSSLG